MQESQERVLQANQLNGCSITRCGRNSLIEGTRPHLVHPCATVVLITTKAQSSVVPVSHDIDIEPIIFHLVIYLGPGIPLSKLDSLGVGCQDFHDKLCQCHGGLSTIFRELSHEVVLKNV